MNAGVTQPTALQPHPSSRAPAVRGVEVRLGAIQAGLLPLTYVLEGRVPEIRLPSPCDPERTPGLWRHTCFEAFVAAGDAPEYCEFNFAPSTQWAAWRFDDYRQGMTPAGELRAPRIAVRRTDQRLQLDAALDLRVLERPHSGAAPPGARARLRLALAAVIEHSDGSLSWWALRHPSDRPDFHHREGFALEMCT